MFLINILNQLLIITQSYKKILELMQIGQ